MEKSLLTNMLTNAGSGISMRLGHTLCARNKVDALVKMNVTSWDILGMYGDPHDPPAPLSGVVRYRNKRNEPVNIGELVQKYIDTYNVSASDAADAIVHLSASVRVDTDLN